MIKVIKRDGREQAFDPAKLRTSIINSGKDAGLLIAPKEAKIVAEDVERKIIAMHGEDGNTSSDELRELLNDTLIELGYPKVAKYFERGRVEDPDDIHRHLDAIRRHTRALAELTEEEEDKDKTHLHRSMEEE